MPNQKFYQPFQKPSKEEWYELLGDSATKTYRVSEKIKVPVFIHESDGIKNEPLVGKLDNDWKIAAQILGSTKDANPKALKALAGGAEEVVFVLRKQADLGELLKGVECPMILTSFRLKKQSANSMQALVESFHLFATKKGWNTQKMAGSFQLEPFTKGKRIRPNLMSYWELARELFPQYHFLCLRQNAKLDVEMAFKELIRQADKLLKMTVYKQEMANAIQFQLFADPNTLKTIASIRAFKVLWWNLMKVHGLALAFPNIFVELDDSSWSKDANQNKILATAQAMAAVIGGCDHLLIPDTTADAFSERISLNIHHILKMEATMDRVIDPASGSMLIEAMTQAIAKSAWDS